MAIMDRNLVKAGTTLTANYKGKAFECQVSKGEDGGLLYTVADRQFTSITGAARWIVGGCPAGETKDLPHRSGWSFWSIAPEPSAEAPTPGETPAEPTETTTPKKTPKKAPSKAKAAKAS